MGIGTRFGGRVPTALPHQPVRIREKTLESGNLFSGSWISASIFIYSFIYLSIIFSATYSSDQWPNLRRFTGDFFENFFLLKFMKNILQYTIDYPNVIYRKKLGVTNSGF